jgi:hypothetical protein
VVPTSLTGHKTIQGDTPVSSQRQGVELLEVLFSSEWCQRPHFHCIYLNGYLLFMVNDNSFPYMSVTVFFLNECIYRKYVNLKNTAEIIAQWCPGWQK